MDNRRYLAKEIDLQAAAYAQASLFLTVPNDVTVEEIQKPGFWVHLHQRISRGALINVVSQDLQLDMELRVLRVENSLVFVRVRSLFETPERKAMLRVVTKDRAAETSDEPLPAIPDGYKIGHAPNGPEKGHYAQLQANGQFIKKGLGSRRAAIEEAIRHARLAGTYEAPAAAGSQAEAA